MIEYILSIYKKNSIIIKLIRNLLRVLVWRNDLSNYILCSISDRFYINYTSPNFIFKLTMNDVSHVTHSYIHPFLEHHPQKKA